MPYVIYRVRRHRRYPSDMNGGYVVQGLSTETAMWEDISRYSCEYCANVIAYRSARGAGVSAFAIDGSELTYERSMKTCRM